MRLSRLQLLDPARPESGLDVRFNDDIAILNVGKGESTRIRFALESLFRGQTNFGRAFVAIDGVEIEVTAELAQHLVHHIGEQSRILDVSAATSQSGQTGSVAAVALRSALEMLRTVTNQLDYRTVDATLQAVLADQKLLETNAYLKVVDAVAQQAAAREALDKIAKWREAVGPLNERSNEERKRSKRRLSGPISYRRFAKVKQQEMESLESGNFESFEDFENQANEAEAQRQQELQVANEEHARAEKYHQSLLNRTCETKQERLLAVYEFSLRLRLSQFSNPGAIDQADQDGLQQSLSIMLRDGAGINDPNRENRVKHALDWLIRSESDGLKNILGRTAVAHAQPLPVVGTVPVIIDDFLQDVEPIAAARALTALDPYIGSVQIVSLRHDPAIVRWATGHANSQ